MIADPAGLGRDRHARVQAAMARHGVGALLVASPVAGSFASGARRVQVAGSGGALPWVALAAGGTAPLVLTTDPDGIPAWMPADAVEPLRWDRDAWLARLRRWLERTDGPVACDAFAPAVAALVADLGRSLVDAAPVLADACAGKSEREIALVAGALAAARDGIDAAAAAAQPGATPAACVRAFAGAMAVHRAGFPLHDGWFRRAGVRLDADGVFAAGDVVALELGCWARGVAGVAGTTVTCAGPEPTAARRAWSAALCALAGHCRAGATTATLRDAARAAGATQAGLLAFGLGAGLEPPHVDLDAADAVPLGAGTVLVLAPVVGGFRATRALVVGTGAPRWIEAAP